MPYLTQEDRAIIDTTLNMQSLSVANKPGELNYQITRICDQYLFQASEDGKPNYALLNEVIGALECAKLELYRRLLVPYEDKKLEENGDVYSEDILT